MKKIKINNLLIPGISILLVGAITFSSYKIWELTKEMDDNIVEPTNYVNNITDERVYPTIKVKDEIIKPFLDENIKVSIPYYNMNDNDQNQQSSLIYYENIYMQNTGIMYTSDKEFNVVAVLDGVVKDIKDDEIMGKIVEIEHNKNLSTIYQSLASTNVTKGQKITQGEIIGISGKNEIVDSNLYALHFEVYRNGELQNPEDFFKLSVSELNE